jgi:hypothetical protein
VLPATSDPVLLLQQPDPSPPQRHQQAHHRTTAPTPTLTAPMARKALKSFRKSAAAFFPLPNWTGVHGRHAAAHMPSIASSKAAVTRLGQGRARKVVGGEVARA